MGIVLNVGIGFVILRDGGMMICGWVGFEVEDIGFGVLYVVLRFGINFIGWF